MGRPPEPAGAILSLLAVPIRVALALGLVDVILATLALAVALPWSGGQ